MAIRLGKRPEGGRRRDARLGRDTGAELLLGASELLDAISAT